MSTPTRFGATRADALVDSMIGNQYDVVKTVYNNLDAIKTAQEDIDWDFIKGNIDVITNVSNNAGFIKNVSQNLSDILAAPTLAQQYVTQAKTEIDQAIVDGQSYIAESKKAAQSITDAATKLQESFTSIEDIKDDIVIVAENIEPVKTTATNIDDIKTVADYLDATDAKPIAQQDYGVIGSSDTEVTGVSPIEVVATHIGQIIQLHANLKDLLYLAQDGNVDHLIKLANKIEDYIDEVKANKEAIDQALETFDIKQGVFECKYKDMINSLDKMLIVFNTTVQDAEEKIQSLVDSVKNTQADCQAIADKCNSLLISIKEVYVLTKEQLETDYRSYNKKITVAGDTQVFRVQRAGDDLVESLETTVNVAVNDAVDRVKRKADFILETFTDKLDLQSKETFEKFYASVQQTEEAFKKDIDAYADKKIADITGQFNTSIKTIQDETVTSLTQIKSLRDEVVSEVTATGNDLLEQIRNNLLGVYKYCGSVNTVDELPKDAVQGDTYNVRETGANYAWTGTEWDNLGADHATDFGVIGS